MMMASEIKHAIEENVEVSQAQPAVESHTVLTLEGMTCATCAMRIEKGLKKVPGVMDTSVNLASELATVTYDPAQANVEQMVQKVEAVGYKATPYVSSLQVPAQETRTNTISETLATPLMNVSQEDEQSRRKHAEITHKRNLLILEVILTLPVAILTMFFVNRFPGENYLLLALTTPVWAIVGWEFHRGAIKTLRYGSANMDTLISVGSTAAYAMSVVATFFPHVLDSITFYDTTALMLKPILFA